ncbi:MAG TPA: hypothetical protein IAB66_11465 [Candidatus Caccousia avistercoris]|nr:hypothetical protein [Candidatus Caccousia avistercoris]
MLYSRAAGGSFSKKERKKRCTILVGSLREGILYRAEGNPGRKGFRRDARFSF